MVTIKIDGKTLQVEENTSVLECALSNGIYIPHLCYHKDLAPYDSCRLCIVEVEGREGVCTSCTLKAKDNMSVRTWSPEIDRLRKLAMELLLTGHPEDCSSCPKYGDCELQTLIQYIGPRTGRLKMRMKGFKPWEDNPLFVHDMNRCILCGRCVRACRDLRGVEVLQYKKKDMEVYIGTLHDKLLSDANCRFCGACAEVCPTGTIRDKISGMEKTREEALIPCRYTCPAHTDVPRYVRFAKRGEFDKAAAVIREKVPFPVSLGHICNHVCEGACKRRHVSDPMSIRAIKRYVSENDSGFYWKGKGKQLPDTGRKICVVGAGPAGMTAAYYLRKQGHAVEIKEALPSMGGMLRYGIPSYRLPKSVVEQEAQIIFDQGVRISYNEKVDRPAELLKEFDAVLMATGGHKGVVLPMPGSDLEGVLVNADFLRNTALGKPTGMGDKVIVLGGGNVAFDCARTAKRLGAKEVHLACLEARDKMTADEEEIIQAQEEGVCIYPARTFERITGETSVTGVDFMEVESFTFDENRRAVIKKKENSFMHIEADTVIFAVGQRPDLDETCGLALGRGNSIVVNNIEEDKRTSVPGIFAAGDVIYGTKSVIMAIESGRQAARQIDIFLGGDGDISEKFAPEQDAPDQIGAQEGFGDERRRGNVIEPAQNRKDDFHLFDHGLCDKDICGEAGRCLQCDLRMRIARPRLWADYEEQKKERAEV